MKLLPVIFSDKIIFSNSFNRTTLAMALILMGLLLIAYSIIVLRVKNAGRKSKVKAVLAGSGLEAGAYQDALKILDRARADSLKILGRAQSKAQSVLNSTYTISKESKEKLDDNLRNIYEKQEETLAALTKDLLNSYKSTVEEGKEENIRTLYEATESMKKGALEGVTEFKEAIKKKTLEASGQLESKIESEYVNVEKEIEAYKSERLNNLNNKIFDILANVYAEVIGQDLDQIKHEKLILGMLKDELRKSGIRNTPRPGTDK